MTKLTAPLFSASARGTLADSITFSSWFGIKYAKVKPVPTNPQSVAQTDRRLLFSYISNTWNRRAQIGRDPWLAQAATKPWTARNAFIGHNLLALIGETSTDFFVWAPGQGSALAPADLIVTPGSHTFDVSIIPPTPLTDWTLVSAVCGIMRDIDPSQGIATDSYHAEDFSSPYTAHFINLNIVIWQIGAWLRWLAPDGSTRYSYSISTQATPLP